MNVKGVTTQQKSVAVAVLELRTTERETTTNALGALKHFRDEWPPPGVRRASYPLGQDATNSTLRRLERRGIAFRAGRTPTGGNVWAIVPGAIETVLEWAKALPEAVAPGVQG